jgi:hypothetical protein
MVLANGQYMFTSSDDGLFELTVPLNAEGQITVYTYAGRLGPQKRVIYPNAGIDMTIAMLDDAGDEAIDVTYAVETIDSKWVQITGTVTYNGSPASAMVLANGQYMFTSSDDGQFDLVIPLSAQGTITLYCYAGRLQPYKNVFSP